MVHCHLGNGLAVVFPKAQGSVLGSLLFALYVNELLLLVSSKLLMFADDIKLYRTIYSPEDCLILQRDINFKYHLNGQNIGSCHLMLQNVKLYTLVVPRILITII